MQVLLKAKAESTMVLSIWSSPMEIPTCMARIGWKIQERRISYVSLFSAIAISFVDRLYQPYESDYARIYERPA